MTTGKPNSQIPEFLTHCACVSGRGVRPASQNFYPITTSLQANL